MEVMGARGGFGKLGAQCREVPEALRIILEW